MSRENVEVVRKLYDGWSRGDFSVAMEHFAPEIEFVSEFGVDRGSARGLDGMRRAWRDQLSNWESWRTGEIKDLRDLGEWVLVLNTLRGRGRLSGVEVELPDAAAAFRFQDGKIVYLLATDRLEAALEAVGLRE